MRTKEIETSDISDYIRRDAESLYLLLETEFFEDAWSDVCDIDFGTVKRWLWSDTFLDQHETDGPLLVEVNNNSALISHYIEHWSTENSAIVIKTPYSMELLIQHLQSLILIMLPDGTHAKMRLQEPRKLAGILNSLQKDTDYESLMGPIKEIIWCENCGKQTRWLGAMNDKMQEPKHTKEDMFWFQFQQEYIDKINTNEALYFIHQLASKVSEKFDIDMKEAIDKTHEYTKEARQSGFLQDNEMEHYVNLRMDFGDFRNNETAKSLLIDKNYEPGGRLQKVRIHLENSSEGALL